MASTDSFEDLNVAYITPRPNGFTVILENPYMDGDPKTDRRLDQLVEALQRLAGIQAAGLDYDIDTPITVVAEYDGTRPTADVLQDVKQLTNARRIMPAR